MQSVAGKDGKDRLTLGYFGVILVCVIFLQRFAINLPASSVAINLLVTYACVGVLLYSGRLSVSLGKLALYCAVAGVACIGAAVNADTASIPSLILLLFIYGGFVFTARTDRATYEAVLDIFQILMLVVAVLGIVQFFAQFIVRGLIPFSFEGLLPESILLRGVNTAVPLYYGSPIFKSNGLVFVEPSTFSQFLAFALLIDIVRAGMRPRMVVYALALALSYSGTGPLMLAVFMPYVVLWGRGYLLAIGAVIFIAVLALFGDVLHLDAIVRRFGEFQSTQTSGFARFISPFWLISDFVADSPIALLIGLGPGSISDYVTAVTYTAHDPSWGKLFFEYGIVGFATFFTFLIYCLFVDTHSRLLSAALLFGFLFFGGMLLDPRLHALILVFAVLQKREPAPAPKPAATFRRLPPTLSALAGPRRASMP